MDVEAFERLQNAMENFEGDVENVINNVLHNEASPILQESIRRLMPVSGKRWRGKKGPAKSSNSLTDEKENLSVTVKSSKAYQYLYFPDDGTNTRRHVGNQQFFKKGAELKQDEIIDRCVNRLVNSFEG